MFAAMLKPALVVVSLIAGGLVTVQVIHHATTSIDAAGRPMDWAGDGIKCQKCGAALRWGTGHSYKCSGCQADVVARFDRGTNMIEFRDPR